MNNTATVNDAMSLSALEYARALELPTRDAVLRRDPSVQQFWLSNRHVLADAWREWEEEQDSRYKPDASLVDAQLRKAVAQAWADPTKESAVQDLWQEVSDGVYMCQFFDPERLSELRAYLDDIADAKIPTRPPYGIVLNRYGAMLDPRSEGYLAAPGFQTLYRELMDKYMRPIARLLFPEVMGHDTQTFGFSIQYQAGLDTSLRLHTDASAATLNVNLNLPGETFTGSEVDFYDPFTGKVSRLTFKPGTAMLHRGNIAHAAQPIMSGTRTNFVLWLYGDYGRIPQPGMPLMAANARERWTVPTATHDDFAPF